MKSVFLQLWSICLQNSCWKTFFLLVEFQMLLFIFHLGEGALKCAKGAQKL